MGSQKFVVRNAGSVVLVLIATLSFACDFRRQPTKLSSKARCAEVGRRFVGQLEKQFGGAPAVTDVTFAYNSDADTCLCRYELLWDKGGARHVIVDTLTNAIIADYDTTVDDRRGLTRFQAVATAMNTDRPIPAAK